MKETDLEEALEAHKKGDYETALRLLTPFAEKGFAPAQYNLGLMHRNGWGVAPDPSKAAEWLKLAAKQEYAPAQYNLAVMYRNGCGVPQSDSQAAELYAQAAEQGFAEAQYNLGVMYRTRIIGVIDYNKQAARLFRLAADQGVALAQHNLGEMYYSGDGVKADIVLSLMWINLGILNGNEDAIEIRDKILEKMTPEQIKQAKVLVDKWMQKHFN